ncbi:MAG: DUF58 domain-containing protein [Mariprofundaceae bacterium]|nr:DUF58 domain-containing protein [Mariprofundaceae bacterium]
MKRFSFILFQWLHRISLWRNRFTTLGKFVWVALIFSAALGIDTKATMLHQLFMLLCALFLVACFALWLQRFQRISLQLERQLPSFVTVDVPFHYHVHINNLSKHPLESLLLREEVQYPSPDYASFLAAKDPQEATRNRFDRDVGYYRFLCLHRQTRGVRCEEKEWPVLAAKITTTLSLEAVAIRRGIIQFNRLQARQPEPLGLLHRHHRCRQDQTLLALPRRYHLPLKLAVSGAAQNQQGEMTLASQIGESHEFHTLREYQAGDSPRHIHWPSWARANKPMVKQFQDEHAVRQALVLDCFACAATAQDGQVFEEAISVAASFSSQLDQSDSLLDLMFVGESCQSLNLGRSLAHAQQMLETLASLSLCHDASFENLSQFVMQHIGVLSSCVLVLMDWDEARQELVKALLACEVEVTVLLILPENAQEPALAVMAAHHERWLCLRMGHIQDDLMRMAS